jgi:hypothetical protein
MKPPSTLYHFTCHLWWRFIQAEGITRGECPVTATRVLQHPNLTTDPEPHTHGWALPDKRSVRLTVEIPRKQWRGELLRWVELTKQHGMDGRTFRGYVESGGGIERARCWWIFTGEIPPDWITNADVLADASDRDRQSLQLVESEGITRYADFRAKYMRVGPGGVLGVALPRQPQTL